MFRVPHETLCLGAAVALIVLAPAAIAGQVAAEDSWMAEEDLRAELIAIANTASSGIDGDQHQALIESDIPAGRPVDEPGYYQIAEWLRTLKQAKGKVVTSEGDTVYRVLLYTYAPTQENGEVVFVSSSSALEDPPGGATFRETYRPKSTNMLSK